MDNIDTPQIFRRNLNSTNSDSKSVLTFLLLGLIIMVLIYFCNKMYQEPYTTTEMNNMNNMNDMNDNVKNQNNLTADDRTLYEMNKIDSNKNINDVACNLQNSLTDEDKEMIKNYKKQYYNMYSHQIECKNTKGNLSGCAKQCSNPKIDDNNMADYVSLNKLILDKNNKKSCSTCTQKPILSRAVGVQSILDQVTNMDNVSKSFMDSQDIGYSKQTFNNLSRELLEKDKELLEKKKITFDNVNNFANFNNYVAQNGVLETSVDKMAEIRSDVTSSATCQLNKYGQTISEIYDNMMANPYMDYKKSCNNSKINGISENKINDFPGNGNFGGNYGGYYANVNL